MERMKKKVNCQYVTFPEIAEAKKSSAVKVYRQLSYYFIEDNYAEGVMFVLILTTFDNFQWFYKEINQLSVTLTFNNLI